MHIVSITHIKQKSVASKTFRLGIEKRKESQQWQTQSQAETREKLQHAVMLVKIMHSEQEIAVRKDDSVEYNTRSGYIRPDSNFYLSVFGNERSLTTSSNYSSSKAYHATLTSGSASAQDRNYAYPVRCLVVGK